MLNNLNSLCQMHTKPNHSLKHEQQQQNKKIQTTFQIQYMINIYILGDECIQVASICF